MKWWSLHLVATPPLTVIHASDDRKAIFALIPQEDRGWELQHLTEWSSGKPKIKSLEFSGDESDDPQDYVRAGLTPAPGGKYLLVRVFVLSTRHWVRTAIVLLVDVPTFHIVWRRVTSDPLFANSQWRFANANTLIATMGPPPQHKGKPVFGLRIEPEILNMNPLSPGTHEAAALSFPSMDVSAGCSYAVTAAEPADGSTSGATTTAGRLEADSGCGSVLKAAGVSAMNELPGLSEANDRVGRSDESGCREEDRSEEMGAVLFNCREGVMTAKDGFVVRAENEWVMETADENKGLSVPLENYQDYSATLTLANGHKYLLLLRDQVRMDVYAIP